MKLFMPAAISGGVMILFMLAAISGSVMILFMNAWFRQAIASPRVLACEPTRGVCDAKCQAAFADGDSGQRSRLCPDGSVRRVGAPVPGGFSGAHSRAGYRRLSRTADQQRGAPPRR